MEQLDEHFMRRCLELADRAAGRTSPNPMVGCVIVDRGNRIVAEGYHRRAGASHAEIDALSKIDTVPAGCTMYVNLEPCRHDGRTGPCAPAVLEAKIKRLVVGMLDPIAGHRGGARWLSRRGVKVTTGVLRKECQELNRGFLCWAANKRPFVVAKAAITLDGRVATNSGESKWITGAAARKDVHRLRNRLDAVMVGIGTVLADNPQLTVRGVRGGRDPVRVVLDSRLRTPLNAKLLPKNASSEARVIVATHSDAPRSRESKLVARGAEVWRVGRRDGRVDLKKLLSRLGGEGIVSLLLEGGGDVHASAIKEHLTDEVRLYMAPMVFGGRDAAPWVGGQGIARLRDARGFEYVGPPRRLGADLVLRLARRESAPRGATF